MDRVVCGNGHDFRADVRRYGGVAVTDEDLDQFHRKHRYQYLTRNCLRSLHNAAARRLTSEFSYVSDSAFDGSENADHALCLIAETIAVITAHERMLHWLVSEDPSIEDLEKFDADDDKNWML